MVQSSNHNVSSKRLSFVQHILCLMLQHLLSALCVSNSDKHRLDTYMTKHLGSYHRVYNLHSLDLNLFRYNQIVHNMACLRNTNQSKSCLHNHVVRHKHKHICLSRMQTNYIHYSRYILYLDIYTPLLHTFYMYTQMLFVLIYLCRLRLLEVQSVDIYYTNMHLIHYRQHPKVQNLDF
jgi:hypothetical protein